MSETKHDEHAAHGHAPKNFGRVFAIGSRRPERSDNWTPTSGQLKTGPNAQNNWTPNSGQLKTDPNAQTDLTMKRSW